MKALVKSKKPEGIWMVQDAPVPEVGVPRRADQGPEERDLRHGRPHLQLGRVEPADDPGADDRRPRVRGRGRRGGRRGRRHSRPATASRGEGHITCGFCRNCRAGRRHLCRHTVGVGVNRARLLRRVPRHPGGQRVPDPGRHPGRGRGDLRSVRQRRAHRALVRPRRRGRAHHRRRARSASWRPRSPATSARATSSSPT